MPNTPTGRTSDHQPEPQRLRYSGKLANWMTQLRAVEKHFEAERDLDEIEDRCIRMFGGDVTYLQDERIIRHD